MRRAIVLTLLTAFPLAGCECRSGLGRHVQKTGQWVEKKADESTLCGTPVGVGSAPWGLAGWRGLLFGAEMFVGSFGAKSLAFLSRP